jgi:hypothetical protein
MLADFITLYRKERTVEFRWDKRASKSGEVCKIRGDREINGVPCWPTLGTTLLLPDAVCGQRDFVIDQFTLLGASKGCRAIDG